MIMHALDLTKKEAFTESMFEILKSDELALVSSIGHRNHLFDTVTDLPPSIKSHWRDASVQIARH